MSEECNQNYSILSDEEKKWITTKLENQLKLSDEQPAIITSPKTQLDTLIITLTNNTQTPTTNEQPTINTKKLSNSINKLLQPYYKIVYIEEPEAPSIPLGFSPIPITLKIQLKYMTLSEASTLLSEGYIITNKKWNTPHIYLTTIKNDEHIYKFNDENKTNLNKTLNNDSYEAIKSDTEPHTISFKKEPKVVIDSKITPYIPTINDLQSRYYYVKNVIEEPEPISFEESVHDYRLSLEDYKSGKISSNHFNNDKEGFINLLSLHLGIKMGQLLLSTDELRIRNFYGKYPLNLLEKFHYLEDELGINVTFWYS